MIILVSPVVVFFWRFTPSKALCRLKQQRTFGQLTHVQFELDSNHYGQYKWNGINMVICGDILTTCVTKQLSYITVKSN